MRTLKIMDQSGVVFFNDLDYLPEDIKKGQRMATVNGVRIIVKDEKTKTKRLVLLSNWQ